MGIWQQLISYSKLLISISHGTLNDVTRHVRVQYKGKVVRSTSLTMLGE